uniref:STAS domain-containing protein n=1 Tax=Paractinoplanes polyasparticus TaxID=2856853 RepID=UPI001C860C18|nr:STAS domain-containing protein [Actinoplanes polyasparticus]
MHSESHHGRIALAESGDVAILTLRGDIDATIARGLRDSLTWAVDHHPGVVLDVSAAAEIAPAGLDVLVRARRRGRGRGTPLCLVAPSRHLRAALGGDSPFSSFEDCESAVAWLRTAALPATGRGR